MIIYLAALKYNYPANVQHYMKLTIVIATFDVLETYLPDMFASIIDQDFELQ